MGLVGGDGDAVVRVQTDKLLRSLEASASVLDVTSIKKTEADILWFRNVTWNLN